MTIGRKTGGKDWKVGEAPKSAGGPKGPRWGPIIRQFMEAPATKEFEELAREMGICGNREKATMRMAILAKAVKTYMYGQERVIGSGENERIVTEKAGDPRILAIFMDREDGKPVATIEAKVEGGAVVILPDNGTSRD